MLQHGMHLFGSYIVKSMHKAMKRYWGQDWKTDFVMVFDIALGVTADLCSAVSWSHARLF